MALFNRHPPSAGSAKEATTTVLSLVRSTYRLPLQVNACYASDFSRQVAPYALAFEPVRPCASKAPVRSYRLLGASKEVGKVLFSLVQVG